MEKHQKFLEFNGKNIVFLSVDGTYWIPIKPICEAIGVNADRSYRNLVLDPILGPARAIQPVQVSKKGKKQLRNMTCIPEKYIYGWLFSLRSDSEELTKFKKTCYELLFNHFHGTITNRKELLLERNTIDTEIHNIKATLKESDKQYKDLQALQAKRKKLSTELNSIDKELVKQPELFLN